jgi:hypothetical protein
MRSRYSLQQQQQGPQTELHRQEGSAFWRSLVGGYHWQDKKCIPQNIFAGNAKKTSK